MDSDRIICLNEDDCDESQNYNNEDEFLDKKYLLNSNPFNNNNHKT